MQISTPPAAPLSLNLEKISDPESLVRRAAFDLLARREHSRQELVTKIFRRFSHRPELGVTTELIETVLMAIADKGLQSDQRYLESFIRSRIQQGYGPVRIAQELKQKKITAEQFEPLLDSRSAEWMERAKAARERKFSGEKVFDQKAKAKQMRFLQYRGYSFEQIQFAFKS